jgi:hypothetical protein
VPNYVGYLGISPAENGEVSSTFSPPGVRTDTLFFETVSFALPPVGMTGILTHHPVTRSLNNPYGAVAPAFSDDFYNRIHINPNPVDFGSVIEDTTVTVEMWNAFFTDTTITSYTDLGFAGLSLDPAQVPPPDVVIGPLVNYQLDISATTDGPGVISAKLQFAATGKYFPLITITGRRAKLFPFATSWDRDIVDEYEWKTNVIETDSGEERRYRLRKWPRRSVQLGMAAVGDLAGELRVAMQSAQSADYALPLWQYESELTQAASAGATELFVNTTDSDYQAGGSAILIESHLRFETVGVESIQADRLVLTTEGVPGQAWAKGTKIYPVRVGILDPEIEFSHPSGNVSRAVVNFDSTDQEKTFSSHGFASYLGYPVIPWMPNWANGRKYTSTRKMEALDGGIHPVSRYVKSLKYGEKYSFEWFLGGRASVKKFLALAQLMAGRCNPVWVPTWQEDMRVRLDYAFGEAALHVTSNFISKTYRSSVINDLYVRVKLLDGSEYYDRVEAASTDPASPTNDVITLETGFAATFRPIDVMNFCLMPLCRLDQDSVILTWKSAHVAESTTTFVYVPEQP